VVPVPVPVPGRSALEAPSRGGPAPAGPPLPSRRGRSRASAPSPSARRCNQGQLETPVANSSTGAPETGAVQRAVRLRRTHSCLSRASSLPLAHRIGPGPVGRPSSESFGSRLSPPGRPAKVQIDPLAGGAYHEPKSGVDRHAVGRRRDHSAGALGKMIYESADTGRGITTADARVHLVATGVHRSVSGTARSCTFVDEQYSPLTGKCSSRGGTEDRSCETGSAFHDSVSTGSPDVGCPPAPRGSRRRGPGGLASPTPSRSS
jgi:hypothetical protein